MEYVLGHAALTLEQRVFGESFGALADGRNPSTLVAVGAVRDKRGVPASARAAADGEKKRFSTDSQGAGISGKAFSPERRVFSGASRLYVGLRTGGWR